MSALKEHGKAILETTKDHLAGALDTAPPEGWTAVELAERCGLLLQGAPFEAVFAHHLAPVLVKEGRAQIVGDGALARYAGTARRVDDAETGFAAATAAPQVWGSSASGELQIASEPIDAQVFPEGEADEATQGPPPGHEGPWIP